MKKNQIILIVFACLQCIIILWSVLCSANIWFPVALSLWMYLVAYLLTDLNKNVEFLGFLCSFFVFLLGGQVAMNFLGYEYKTVFPNEIESHANLMLILSMLSLLLGYELTKRIPVGGKKRRYTAEERSDKIAWYKSVRFVSLITFYVTAVFWFLILAERILYVRSHGYYASYSEFSSRFPYIIRALASFSPFAFYIFLSTKPKKKIAMIPLGIYVVYLAASILTGRRIYVAIGIMILAVYLVHQQFESGEVWISKKMIIAGCIALPFFLIFLQFYGVARMGKDGGYSGIFKTLIDFVGGQGYTVNVIKYGKVYAEELGLDKVFSNYTTLKFLRTSALTKLFMPPYDFQYNSYTVGMALKGNSLADSLTYLIAPKTFLSGGGTGGCYIAELYHDFGWIGVVIGNMFYGAIFACLSKFRNRGIVFLTISYILLEGMFRVPRYNFDYFLNEFTVVSSWAFAIMVFAGAYFLKTYVRGAKKDSEQTIQQNKRN